MAETFWRISLNMLERQSVTELSEVLHESRHAAGMLVALLYAFGASNADDKGSINDYHDRKIEGACGWSGKRGELIEAFCAAGVLIGDAADRAEDNPLRIAGWQQIAADILEGRRKARERQNKARGKKQNDEDVTRDDTCDSTRDDTCDTVNNRTSELKNNRTTELGNMGNAGTEPMWNPPTPEEVRQYMDEYTSGRALHVDTARASERFWNHYAGKGWTVQHWQPFAASWIEEDARKIQSNPALGYEQRKLTDEDFAGVLLNFGEGATP